MYEIAEKKTITCIKQRLNPIIQKKYKIKNSFFLPLSFISILGTIILLLILALAAMYHRMRRRMGGSITRHDDNREEEVFVVPLWYR